MAQASGIRKTVSFVPEVEFGVTPASPQTQSVEYVTFSGTLDTPLLVDPSIRPDRQTAYARRGNESVTAELEVIHVADNFDVLLEAGLRGTWTDDELVIGDVQRSFAIEEGYTDLGQYHVFNGCVVNTISQAVVTGELVNTNFTFLGSTESAFTSTPIDSTPTPAPFKPKAYHVGGTFTEGGTVVAYLTAVNWELNNNLAASNALGVAGVRAITSGAASITGTVTALFESAAIYNKFKNGTFSSLEYSLSDADDTYTFSFPKITYTAGSIPSGTGALVLEMSFTALVDEVTGTSLKITRS